MANDFHQRKCMLVAVGGQQVELITKHMAVFHNTILLPRINCIILSSHKLPVICIRLFRIASDNMYASGSCKSGFSYGFNALFDSTLAGTREDDRRGTASCDDLFACRAFYFFVENSKWADYLLQYGLKHILSGNAIYPVTCVPVNHYDISASIVGMDSTWSLTS